MESLGAVPSVYRVVALDFSRPRVFEFVGSGRNSHYLRHNRRQLAPIWARNPLPNSNRPAPAAQYRVCVSTYLGFTGGGAGERVTRPCGRRCRFDAINAASQICKQCIDGSRLYFRFGARLRHPVTNMGYDMGFSGRPRMDSPRASPMKRRKRQTSRVNLPYGENRKTFSGIPMMGVDRNPPRGAPLLGLNRTLLIETPSLKPNRGLLSETPPLMSNRLPLAETPRMMEN